MNESKISFAQGFDFNAAVKFSGKDRSVIPPDDDSDRAPYYALNTTQRDRQPDPLTAQYETLRNEKRQSEIQASY